jgi:hypothetical protein
MFEKRVVIWFSEVEISMSALVQENESTTLPQKTGHHSLSDITWYALRTQTLNVLLLTDTDSQTEP